MTLVTSKKNVFFPKLNWGINAGETRELPAEKEAQKIILAHNAISKAKAGGDTKNEDSSL